MPTPKSGKVPTATSTTTTSTTTTTLTATATDPVGDNNIGVGTALLDQSAGRLRGVGVCCSAGEGAAAAAAVGDTDVTGGQQPAEATKDRSLRGSVSNENNILLDPEVLTDYNTQALLLTVLVGLIRIL